jgi:hypothetical protein
MNKPTIDFFYDEHGRPRVRTNSEFALLGLYLEFDIQNIRPFAEQVIQRVDEVEKGTQASSKIAGNAFRLVLSHETARIESLFDDHAPGLELPLSDFRNVLQQWLDWISN